MTRRARKRSQLVERAKEWILRNQDASISTTIEKTGVSYGTVTALRRELRNAGLLHVYPHTPGNAAMGDAPPQTSSVPAPLGPPLEVRVYDPQIAAQEVDAVAADTTMPREARRKRLEYFVAQGTPDHAIRANAAIEAMDRADAKIDDSGPPVPATIDDGIADVADMVEALMVWGGEESVKQAVTIGMSRVLRDRKAEEAKDVQPNEPAPTAAAA